MRFLSLAEHPGYDGSDLPDDQWQTVVVPYEPSPHAIATEIPPSSVVEILIYDTRLHLITTRSEPPGVDPATVRVRVDDVQYTALDHPEVLRTFSVPDDPERLRVVLTVPGGFPRSSAVSLLVQAGDRNAIVDPPPLRARFMRDERITFTTQGDGRQAWQVPNRGSAVSNSMPTSLSFAAGHQATEDGKPLLAHHYALLDSNTVHKHAALFIHYPKEGAAHAVLGYAGMIWGFSGMNEHGLTFAFNNSDTLNNPITGEFLDLMFEARVALKGVPIGVVGRELLTATQDVQQARDLLQALQHTGGWNVLLADAGGGILGVELDSNVPCSGAPPDRSGTFVLTPGERTAEGEFLASVGNDDLFMGAHFRKNLEDIRTQALFFDVKPQRYWTSFYYRSVRTVAILQERLMSTRGKLSPEEAMDVLRTPDLVDLRDSMNAAVYQPHAGVLFWAAGEVPATDGEFHRFSFREEQGGGR